MRELALLIFISAFLVSLPKLLLAQEVQETELALYQGFYFQPAKVLDEAELEYSTLSLVRGREGSVLISFMVDTAGKPFEVRTLSATGDGPVERSAIRALNASTFSPAQLNGQAVDSLHHRHIYTFEIEGGFRASQSFADEYRPFHAAIEEGDIEDARSFLRKMERLDSLETKIYEQGLYLYSASRLANLEADAYKHLTLTNHLVAFGRHRPDILSESKLYEVLVNAFRLQAQAGYYAEAAENFQRIKQHLLVSQLDLAQLQPIYDQLVSIKGDDGAYSVEAEIDDESRWYISLYKSEFYIDRAEGRLEEIKLLCEASYQNFDYQEGATYTLSENWGECVLEVTGRRGSTFYLTQQ